MFKWYTINARKEDRASRVLKSLEVGKKELDADSVFMGRRDKEYKDRILQSRQEFLSTITAQLDDIISQSGELGAKRIEEGL